MYASVKWRGKHLTHSSELHATHAFMWPKRVVMKFDKLLSVIVPRCEKHIYFKLTNKRSTDTCLLTNNRHSIPMNDVFAGSIVYGPLGLYWQTDNSIMFCTQILIVNQNDY